jgi:hypothetical protein
MSNLNRVIKITKIFPRPKPGEKKNDLLKDILYRLLVSIHKLSTSYPQTRPSAPSPSGKIAVFILRPFFYLFNR